MNVILAPTGGHLAKRVHLPMSARQVTWFIDPEALLWHLKDLGTLQLAAFCQSCYRKGLPEEVAATFDPTTRAWTVRCSCADYPPLKDTGKGLTIRQPKEDGTVKIHKVRSVDELLQKLGWSFKCMADCAKLGMHDGVEGQNDPQGQTLMVSCGCTIRVYTDPQGVPS